MEEVIKGGIFFCDVNNRKVPVLVKKVTADGVHIKNLSNNRNLIVKDKDRFLELVPGDKAGKVLTDYTAMVLHMVQLKELKRMRATLLHCLDMLIKEDKTVAGLTVAGLIKRLKK